MRPRQPASRGRPLYEEDETFGGLAAKEVPPILAARLALDLTPSTKATLHPFLHFFDIGYSSPSLSCRYRGTLV